MENTVNLKSSIAWSDFKLNSDGMVPVIAQDYQTNEVLMLAYMNEEAFNTTLETGKMTYWSRSRNELWTKGLTSGHLQFVKSLTLDCDNDTILAKVEQIGAACHTGNRTCFFKPPLCRPCQRHRGAGKAAVLCGLGRGGRGVPPVRRAGYLGKHHTPRPRSTGVENTLHWKSAQPQKLLVSARTGRSLCGCGYHKPEPANTAGLMHRRASECSKPLYKTLLLLWTFEQLELFNVSMLIPSCSR